MIKLVVLTAFTSIFCNGINCATPNYTDVNEQIRLMSKFNPSHIKYATFS